VKGPTFWINNVWLVATLCAKLAPQASFEPKNGFVQFIALLHTLFSVFRTSISLKKKKNVIGKLKMQTF